MKKICLFMVLALCSCAAAFAATAPSPIGDLKQKQSLGFDLTNSELTYRIWANEKVGLDVSAGFTMNGNDSLVSMGAGMVSPMTENDVFAINLIPGLKFGYGSGASVLTLVGGVGAEFMLVLSGISKDLTLSSEAGVYIGISSSNNKTNLLVAAAKDFALSPIIIRYYY
jgi:hypothetical protein